MLNKFAQQAEPSGRTGSPLWALVPFLAFAWILIFWARFYLTLLPGVGTGELDRIDVLLLVPQILWGNLFPSQVSEDSSWLNLLQRLPTFSLAVFILLSAWSIGRHVLRRLDLLQRLGASERNALAGGVGLSFVSLAMLMCGLTGLMWRPFVGILLVVPVLVEGTSLLHAKRNHAKEVAPHAPALPLFDWWLIAGCVCFLLPMLLGAMLPSNDFDVNEYHLEGPKEYFLAGRIHFLPHNVYTSFPFLTEMLSLLGMVLTNDWFYGSLVGKTVLMGFAPLTALGVFAVGQRVADARTGRFAALIYLSTPWVYRISIIAYTEGAMCCFVILATLSLLIWLGQVASAEARSPRSESWLCGFLAGSAVATKYPGMVLVAIPLALVLCLAAVLNRVAVKELLKLGGLYVLGGVIAFGPWVLKNSIETGNPVYPLMYSVFGGEDWNPELDEKWKAGHARPAPLFKSPGAMWDELVKYSVDVALGSVWQSVLLFGLAPLAFLYSRKSRAFWVVCGSALTVLAVWYSMTHLIDRFWVPVLPLISVMSGVGVCALFGLYFPGGHGGNRGRSLLGVVLGVLCVVSLVYNFAFMTTPASGYNAYLLDLQRAREQVKPPSVMIAEQAAGKSGRVLFVGEAMVFDCETGYRYNTVFDKSLLELWTARKLASGKWELLPAKQILQTLQAEGITHLLVNWDEILRYRTTYGYTDFVSPARIAELAEKCSFVEVNLPESFGLRDWETLDESSQQQVDEWGPELKTLSPSGTLKTRRYQLFEIVTAQD